MRVCRVPVGNIARNRPNINIQLMQMYCIWQLKSKNPEHFFLLVIRITLKLSYACCLCLQPQVITRRYLQFFPVMKSAKYVQIFFNSSSMDPKKPFILVFGGWNGIWTVTMINVKNLINCSGKEIKYRDGTIRNFKQISCKFKLLLFNSITFSYFLNFI